MSFSHLFKKRSFFSLINLDKLITVKLAKYNRWFIQRFNLEVTRKLSSYYKCYKYNITSQNRISLGRKINYVLASAFLFKPKGHSKEMQMEGENVIHNDTSVEALFLKVDKLLQGDGDDRKKALDHLLEYITQQEGNVEYLWRLSKAYYYVSDVKDTSKDERRSLLYNSNKYAAQALALDDSNPDVLKWNAISLSAIGDFEGIKSKINNSFKIKEHLDKTIKLKPDDYSTHYLLGRWCFEVYMLSWIERKLASAVFATPPTASLDEALNAFLESDRLLPKQFKPNMLYIAKCLLQQKKLSEALQWLEEAKDVKIKTADDEKCQNEILDLIKKNKK